MRCAIPRNIWGSEMHYTAECCFSLTASYYADQCYQGLTRNIGVYLMGYPVHTNIRPSDWLMQCQNGPIYA